MTAAVEVVPYDNSWPERFVQEEYRPHSEHWFCKPSPEVRTHHLHLVPVASSQWGEAIAFRGYLRRHAEIAAEYAALKRRLATEHRFDREAYTQAKGAFVERVTALALQEERPWNTSSQPRDQAIDSRGGSS